MAVEAGAETGLFPADETARAYLEGRTDRAWTAEQSDPDAEFAQELRIDLRARPLVALPHLPGNVVPIADAAGMKIDQAYIGNCSNGTMTDLRQAAEILRGRHVHPDCRLIVVPATQRIYREAMREGLLDVFVEAGAMVSTPTCGACFGGGMGVLGPGERAVTTTNRNFKGRMGSGEAEVHLANAWVAAAAAVAGELVHPARGAGVIVEGRAVVIPGADVDTDVMYPGQYLNIDDPEQMKPYLFEGFDPTLRDQLGPRRDPRHRPELRHWLLARARPAGDEGLGRAGGRRPELRAHLPTQLRQPRPARRRGAAASRRAGLARPHRHRRRHGRCGRPVVRGRADRAARRGAPVGRRARRARTR